MRRLPVFVVLVVFCVGCRAVLGIEPLPQTGAGTGGNGAADAGAGGRVGETHTAGQAGAAVTAGHGGHTGAATHAGTGGMPGGAPSDPCAHDHGGCDPLVTCATKQGEVQCGACPSGFEDDDGDGRTCTDIDECKRQTFDCKLHATCKNTAGHYECPCNEGYHGDGHKACLANVLCNADGSNCAKPASCVELSGSRYCVCAAWYEGDGATCTDIDECQADNGGCDTAPLAKCTNMRDAAPSCTCPGGYMGSGVGAEGCMDLDECTAGTDMCSRDPSVACANTAGGFTCGSCPAGYEGDGHNCRDVDECLVNNGGCDTSPMAMCMNLRGSRSCICPKGYAGAGVGNAGCSDIDECKDGSHTCSRSPAVACANTAGGFTCDDCPGGYTGDGHSCVDIDECKTNNGGCGATSAFLCKNSVGGPPSCTAIDDPTTPGDDRPGFMLCAGTSCATTGACCGDVSAGRRTCLPPGEACTLGSSECDGPEDCSTGEICWEARWALCSAASSTDPRGQRLCHRDAHCAAGQTCMDGLCR